MHMNFEEVNIMLIIGNRISLIANIVLSGFNHEYEDEHNIRNTCLVTIYETRSTRTKGTRENVNTTTALVIVFLVPIIN
jgi:hypothetical protein